jgi:outer membrane protein assembly factor BamD (BamD/ComL family)
VGSMKYLDFELEIGIGEGRYYPVAVIESPAGEARETMRFPFDQVILENRLQALQLALLRSGGKRRRVPSREESVVQEFGHALYDALLAGEIRSRYDVSLLKAAQAGKGLRLKLRIQSPEMAALPWEFLYDSRQGEYVALVRSTPLLRYLELPRPIQPLAVNPPLRVLGMIASPKDQVSLDHEREKQRVEKALMNLQDQGLVVLDWLQGETWRDLQREMRRGPWHVFHFIGHGGFDPNADEGFVSLSNRDGSAHKLFATEMGRLLANHRALKLVLLNACEGARGGQVDVFSSTAAVLVRRGIAAVVAMQYEITDRAAIEFSRAFYEALADGVPVDAAVCEARTAISLALSNTVEWGTPVLYTRTPDGMLFDLTRIEPSGRVTPRRARPAPEVDREQDERLEQLYTRGLEAFYTSEWDEACRAFQAIVDERPDFEHGDAATKLELAKRRSQLESLYADAQSAREGSDWSAMQAALKALVGEDPEYKDAAALLEMARRQKELGDLYSQAQRLQKVAGWQAVINVFAQIRALDPKYPDPDNLLPTAEQELKEQNRQADLNDLYNRALKEINGERWQEAQQLLTQLEEMEPGFRKAKRLLDKAEAELAKAETVRLLSAADEAAQAEDWPKAVELYEEALRLDKGNEDTAAGLAQAQEALRKEKAERERQAALAKHYGEAVDRVEAGDWPEAERLLLQVQETESDYRDVETLLARARAEREKQERLDALYEDARKSNKAGEWQDVLDLMDQIKALDAGHADPDGLRSSSEQGLERESRYEQGVQHLNAEEWEEAIGHLEVVEKLDPNYRDVAALLEKARAALVHPSLAVKLSGKCLETGDKASWTVTVRNDGDEDLHDVVVKSRHISPKERFDLAPGRWRRFTFTTRGVAGHPMKETVTVTGVGSSGQQVRDEASATVQETVTVTGVGSSGQQVRDEASAMVQAVAIPPPEKILDVLKRFASRSSHLHLDPDIPAKKLRNGRKACEVPESEQILGLLDFTVFGSAKDCLLFGCRDVYYANGFNYPNTKVKVSYTEFPVRVFEDKDGDVSVGRGLILRVGGCGFSDCSAAVTELLNAVKDLII